MAHQEAGRSVWRLPHTNALGQLLMVTGLTGFAISQPLLSVAGESPATFAFRSVEGVSLVLFALAVAFVPPLVIWAVLRLIALVSARASDIAFVVVAALLAVAAGIQIAKAFDVQRAALIALGGILIAATLVVAYLRVRSVDLWLRFTAILPVGAVFLFLFASPTSALLSPTSGDVAQVAAGDEPPVVMIMLDEFPTQSFLADDRTIDAERFPNLAALTDQFTWYRDYTVPSNQTLMSIPSILTSTLPTQDGAVAAEHPNSVFTALAPTHDLHVFESATKLCALDACAAEAAAGEGSSGLLGTLRDMPELWSQRVSLDTAPLADLGEFAEEVEGESASEPELDAGPSGSGNAMDQLQGAIASMPTRAVDFTSTFAEAGPRPGFFFLHLLLPHQPWNFYPDGSRYTAARYNLDNAEWARASLEQRHLFQAQYADRLIGEMMQTLRESGLYDDAMVIVTADHGISFDLVPNGRDLADGTLPEVAYAPLFIKNPGQQVGGIDDTNVMGTDLLPTIADVAGVEVDWEIVGAPIASDAVQNRGPEKVIYDFGTRKEPAPRTPIGFDSSKRPRASDRLVGPLGSSDNLTAGLVGRLGVADLLGTEVSSLDVGEGATSAVITERTEKVDSGLLFPTIGAAIPLVEPGAIVLVALDGVIVAAAPLIDGKFEALWPPGAATTDLSRVQLVLDRDGVRSTISIL